MVTINEIFFRLNWKAALFLSRMTVKLACRNINRNEHPEIRKKRIVFLPYSTNDCRTLHTIFAVLLDSTSKFSSDVKIIDPQARMEIQEDVKSYSYEEKISGLIELGYGYEIWRGMADDYRRRCNSDEYFEISPYTSEVMARIRQSHEHARQIVEEFEVFFLPDLAYTFNRTIHFYAKRRNKRVFILNPHGQLLDVSSSERYPSQTKTVDELCIEYDNLNISAKNELVKLAKQYFSDRQQGKLKSDREAIKAYKQKSQNGVAHDAKVLMLHCIRDASRELPNKKENFILESDDYFIWTKKMFEKIGKEQENWKIKIHPSSTQYPDEIEIIDRLAQTFGIKPTCFNDVPSTAQILKEKRIVFTYSGTIALETAAAGFKSLVFGGTYPEWMAKRVTLNDLNNSSFSGVEILNSQEKEKALVILLLSAKKNRPIYEICPQMSVGPSTSKLKRSRSEVKSSKSFFVNLLNRDRRSELHLILEKLSYSLVYNSPFDIDVSKRIVDKLNVQSN
ncbi:hypothetical protein DLE04_01050 [Actinobacteria bacterium IMCC26103]|nr:hypothetical protein DLE04_01050 [Actinobacteria bacterium IMCC26103]